MKTKNEKIEFLLRVHKNSFVAENSNDKYLLDKYKAYIVKSDKIPFITNHGAIHYGQIELSTLGKKELNKLIE